MTLKITVGEPIFLLLATINVFTPSLLPSTVRWAGTNAISMALCIVLLLLTAVLLKDSP